ncbi:hypothetical protein [Spirosoma foliorum]|uniref:IS30 family transposase n=1 Tax=Spirosoma foliorum TaxID=2710596 RepID=A0A7G5GZN6_9BACT|nr:hypothetical protein [Spirosoma foliorum]QMW04328.1 hypothetical protein H3H32_05105 [Spirosoma foliorum]
MFAAIAKLLHHVPFNTPQRYQIGALRHLKPAQIARRIGKYRSVVTRQLARNANSIIDYQPQTVHKAYLNRRPKNATKATPTIYQTIQIGLSQQWSPEQIQGRCQQTGQSMLFTSTIYNYIWYDYRQGGTLYKHLRHAHKPYRKRYGKPDGRRKAVKQVNRPGI